MRMRNPYYKKATTFSLPVIVCITFVGSFLFFHFHFLFHHNPGERKPLKMHKTHQVQFPELKQVEEEIIRIPPPRGKRSPHAAKRRPKRPTTLVDEFLDESSQIRHIFFPSKKLAIDPAKGPNNESMFYFPGRIWMDTDGNPIQAHGGGILYDYRSDMYYWYGEFKDGPTYHTHKKGVARVDIIGVGCYSSRDLWTWKNEGIVLAAEERNETHDLHPKNVLERPKVIYNDKTRKYVMWMHVDDSNYTKAAVGVASSDRPTGPFVHHFSKRPHGFDSRDMTVFKDEDDIAYLVYSSSDNNDVHIGTLADDYLDVGPDVGRVLVGQRREAPTFFRYDDTYYMITSGCSGWAPNEALAHAAGSVMGPWEALGNPCIGGGGVFRSTTFFAQGAFVVPVASVRGLYIFMADRWNPGDLGDSRYVWLPLMVGGAADWPLDYEFGFPLWYRVSIYWHRKWRLPYGWDREGK